MKNQLRRVVAMVLVMLYVFGMGEIQLFAAPNYVTATREINPQTIYVDEEAEVKLNITGTPPVNVVKPNDVILVLDKSGSMKDDNRFGAMKESAKEFVDLFDFNFHQVGVVDYSTDINASPLTTDSNIIKSYIDSIAVGGWTYTGAAIREAMRLLLEDGNSRPDAQPVIVLLTDGQATDIEDARLAAQEAKDAGIVFYTIALLGPSENPETSDANKLMMEMATTSHHHHFVLGSVGLIDIYRAIVKEIGIASAYDVVITETVGPQFEIVPGSYDNNIPRPKVEGNTLTWEILELKADTLQLSYKVKLKDGDKPGVYSVAPNAKVSYKDYAGSKRSYTVPNANLTVKYRPPTISSITPDKGEVIGGETVTITGENFRDGATVKFGMIFATNVQVVDNQTITATVPAGIQGQATVTVTNDDRQLATITYQYFADPIVTSIQPANGPFVGGNSVKINGNYFLSGIKVYFDGQEVSSLNYYNSGYVLVKAPKALKEGAVDVTLENPDGTTLTIKDGYIYEPEIIEKLEVISVTPDKGSIVGGETVTITGKNIDREAKVYFADKEVSIGTYTNSESIKVKVPEGDKIGLVNIAIENVDGTKVTLDQAYEYLAIPAPEITTISPSTGELIGGELVYIDGKNFTNGLTVTVGGKAATVTNYYSTNRVRIRIPAGDQAATVAVILTNPDGQQVVVADAYTYLPAPEAPAPEITNVTPNAGKLEGGEFVTIDGKNFVQGLTVMVDGKEAQVTNFYSAAKIRIKTPTATQPGSVDITITNPDGKQVIAASGYEYLVPPEEQEPIITNLSAENGELVGGEILYIEGENFQPGLIVTFGNNEAQLLNYYTANRIRVKAPAGDVSGTVDVTVTNPSGKLGTLANAYTYNVYTPSITTISPNEGELVGGDYVYIDGKNFLEGLEVTFDGQIAQVANYYNTTRIRVKVPTGTNPGAVDVMVTNPDGQSGIATGGYTYLEKPAELVPEILKFNLSSNLSGAEITSANKNQIIYIHGDGFKSTTEIKIIDDNGTVTIKPLNVYDAKRIRFRIPPTTASGTISISVICDGVESAPATLTIN